MPPSEDGHGLIEKIITSISAMAASQKLFNLKRRDSHKSFANDLDLPNHPYMMSPSVNRSFCDAGGFARSSSFSGLSTQATRSEGRYSLSVSPTNEQARNKTPLQCRAGLVAPGETGGTGGTVFSSLPRPRNHVGGLSCPHCGCRDISNDHGNFACTRCTIAFPQTEMISRDRNGGGSRDEDCTVRGDVLHEFSIPYAPITSAADEARNARTALGINGSSGVPKNLDRAQQITNTAAARAQVVDTRDETGPGPPRDVRQRGHALLRALGSLLDDVYLGLLSTTMSHRATREAERVWSLIARHHAVCSSTACRLDLHACPSNLLALICLERSLSVAYGDACAHASSVETEALGGTRNLHDILERVRLDLGRSSIATDADKRMCTGAALELVDAAASPALPCTDPLDVERCRRETSPLPTNLAQGQGQGPTPAQTRASPHLLVRPIAVRSTLASIPIGLSRQYRDTKRDDDDRSSVSGSSTSTSDLPGSPGCAPTRQMIKRATIQMGPALHLSPKAKVAMMQSLGDDRFIKVIQSDDVLRSASPVSIAAGLAYVAVVATSPELAEGLRRAPATETPTSGSSGSELSSISSISPISPISPRPRNIRLGLFAHAAKMDQYSFRQLVNSLRHQTL